MKRTESTGKLFLLGCAYSNKYKGAPPDLEQVVLDYLDYYWTSNDIFFMLYSLLNHRIGHLVHVERLIRLAQEQNLSGDRLVLLLCLSNKLIKAGYKNFIPVVKKLKTNKLKLKSAPVSESDSFLIERWGLDPDFKEYGAEVRMLTLENVKKFFTLNKILQMNAWLSCRAVVGPNNRADILYLKTSKIVSTANQASILLGCSKDAAYRYWRATEGVERIQVNKKFK